MATATKSSFHLFGAPLTERDFPELERDRGITQEWTEEAYIRNVDEYTAREMFGHTKDRLDEEFTGMAIPYFWPGETDRIRDWRLRRKRPPVETRSNGTVKVKDKYQSAPGGGNKLYFAPRVQPEWLEDPTIPIVILEGEFKTLAAAIVSWHGLGDAAERPRWLAVGLAGVLNWRGKRGKIPTPDGHDVVLKGPIADLDRIPWKDPRVIRRVILLFDVDVHHNMKVWSARNWLAQELRSRGAQVLFADIPEALGLKGFDDVLGHLGLERALAIVENAYDPKEKKVDWVDGKLTFTYGDGHFEFDERGVWYVQNPNDEGKSHPSVWLCDPLEVIALTRDRNSESWGWLVEFKNRDGQSRRVALSFNMLWRDSGTEALLLLGDYGLKIGSAKKVKEYLPIYVREWPTEHRARSIDKPGWVTSANGTVYVLPSETIGEDSETIVFQHGHKVKPEFSISGTVEEWREHVARLARDNSRLMLGLGCAFAGPLLELAGESSGGFHMRGLSSIGKTTAARTGASVWGDPHKYVRSWRVTSAGLEGMAVIHNDGFLPLDEIGQAEGREAGEVVYMLANGLGKGRAERTALARPISTWRLIYLSTGEPSLASHMATAGRRTTAGQELRLLEIDGDAGAGPGMGVVEHLHDYPTSEALIAALGEAVRKYHGAVGYEYLRHLVAERAASTALVESVTAGIRKFIETYASNTVGGQVTRAARFFALAALGLERATSYGYTGWDAGEATEAVAKCFKNWQNGFGSGIREQRQLVNRLRALLEKYGSSRFSDIEAGDVAINDRAGFWRTTVGGDREYLVLPSAFREICGELKLDTAIGLLKMQGCLVPGTDGKNSQKPHLPGFGKKRVYVISVAKLAERE
jgi:uncharacterized protein (DUF927 family)